MREHRKMEPELPPQVRKYTPGEHALMWIGLILPGALSPFAMILFFAMGYDGSVGEVLLFGIPILWLAILLGCCWMCGWIHATKRGPDRIKPRAAKAAALFLLGQVILSPLIGFGACALIVSFNF